MIDFQNILIEPTKTVLTQLRFFLSGLVLMLLILLCGWLISKLVKIAVTKISMFLKFDQLSKKIELDNLLKKGGIPFSLPELIGAICYWLGLLITLVVAVSAVGLPIASDLLNRVVQYVPNVIAAIFILMIGMFIATLLKNIVQTAATNAGLVHSKLLAKVVEVMIIIFSVTITLEKLGIGERIIELAISIILASLGLAFALAFGIGCQDIARKFVSDITEKLKSKN
jgi:hypothetical protein